MQWFLLHYYDKVLLAQVITTVRSLKYKRLRDYKFLWLLIYGACKQDRRIRTCDFCKDSERRNQPHVWESKEKQICIARYVFEFYKYHE